MTNHRSGILPVLIATIVAIAGVTAVVYPMFVSEETLDGPSSDVLQADTEGALVWQKQLETLGLRTGKIVRTIQSRIGESSEIELKVVRGLEGMVVALEVAPMVAGHRLGYPSNLYCSWCPSQECLFRQKRNKAEGERMADALGLLRAALPMDAIVEASREIGAGSGFSMRLELTGTADVSPIVPDDFKSECIKGQWQTISRGGYDRYRGECGAGNCVVDGQNTEGVTMSSGMEIADNRSLACLRALCLLDADQHARLDGTSGTLTVEYRGIEMKTGDGFKRAVKVRLVIGGVVDGDGSLLPGFENAYASAVGGGEG